MRRVVLWVVGITALVGCVVAANRVRDAGPAEVDWQLFRPSPPAVTIGRPTRGPIARTVAAKGVVEPVRQVQVVAKVGGKVADVLVEEGAAVRKGDVLVRLDDATYRSRATSAKTRLDTARTNLDIAEAHLRDLEKDPAAATTPATPAPVAPTLPGMPTPPAAPVGPSKLDLAKNSVEGWKRERKSAEAADDATRTDLDRTVIRASIDGVVEDLAVEVGDDVVASPTVSLPAAPTSAAPPGMMGRFGLGGDGPGAGLEAAPGPARTLCTILDPDQLRVRAWIDEGDVGLVAADQPARIFLPDEPADPVLGRITKVAARGRPTGEVVAYAATIRFDPTRRRPRAGMRVNVEVEVSRQLDLLGTPVQAVMHRKRRDLAPPSPANTGPAPAAELIRPGDSEYVKAVFVLDGDHVRLRPIETGLSDERRVEIVSGLGPDDRIVVGPFRALDTLEDGMIVRAEVDPDADAAVSLTRGPTPPTRRPTR